MNERAARADRGPWLPFSPVAAKQSFVVRVETSRGPAAGLGLRLSWVGPACGGTALRCSLREGGCDASAVPLNAALHRDFSPVRRLRRRTPPRSTALLADPDAPQTQPDRSPASTWAFVTVGTPKRHDRPRAGARWGEWRRREAQWSGGKSAAQPRTGEKSLCDDAGASSLRHRSRPRGASIAAKSARSADRRRLSRSGHRPSACT